MRKRKSSGGVTVNAVAGTHVVMLGLDLSDERRKGCLGFAIERQDHTERERYWMKGTKTFKGVAAKPGGSSSREQPFQSFQWSDYSAKPEHDYTYAVVPLYGAPKPDTPPDAGRRVSVRVKTEAELGTPHSVFFNRGSVATQEYVRRFGDLKPKELDPVRREEAYAWLSRGLLEALVAFVARAEGPDWGVRGALYEFQWPAALAAFGAAAARGADVKVLFDDIGGKGPGAKNRKAIQDAGLHAHCLPRTEGKIMHNKFVVLTHKGTPVAVWTGSTNLTENGIFGHLNCGHSVEDATIARGYLDYWTELSAQPSPARAAEQDWVVAENVRPPDPWDADVTAVFSPHRGQAVLDWYATIAGSAANPGDALFMSFAFGMDRRFKAVYDTEDGVLRVALMDKIGSGAGLKQALIDIPRIRNLPNVVIAIGNRIVTNAFDRWLAEAKGLTSNVQWVHSKFMLVNPLSEAPVVVTGSANFSEPSTDENNENMLVIRGDTRVADIYLGEFMRLYSHYAFRDTLARQARGQTGIQLSGTLAGDDSWQAQGYFTPGSSRCLRRRYFART